MNDVVLIILIFRQPLLPGGKGLVRCQYLLPYGAGTLMRVFTSVTEACRANALPFRVTTATLPAVEVEMPEEAMMVPTMVPPPPALIVAWLPTCQKTFLA